jgi:hypothetical protein
MQEFDLAGIQPDIRKILLIGSEGVGKTNFIKTLPKPIYCFSFDKGYSTLAGEPGIKVGLCMDDDRYHPKSYLEFAKKFEALKAGEKYKWADGKEEPYQTIALDNISFLSTYIFDYYQSVNNNIDKPGGYAVYGLVKSKLQDIINKCVMISNYVVCTALVEASKDDITGEIFFTPDMVGSTKNEIGAWFDGVFYMGVDKTPDGKKVYKLITVGDRRQKAKIRLPSGIANAIAAVETPDFQLLNKKIQEAIKQGEIKK